MSRVKEHPNLCALLDTIAMCEGTAQIEHGDDGYRVLVGGNLFNSYADHPRIHVKVRQGLWSTAAGRYQILERTYNACAKELAITDFTPISQDKIAIKLIRDCGAIPLIEAGNLELAVARIAHIWASLPGAGYGQRERSTSAVKNYYVQAGGTIAIEKPENA